MTSAPDKSPRAITAEEWAKHRQAVVQAMPPALADRELPDVLMPYQSELLRTTAVKRVTIVEKSRRTGYTWGVAADAVLTSGAARTNGGMDTLYIGYNLEMAREFIDVAAMWARSFGEAATEIEDTLFDDGNADAGIKAFRIGFASGFEIIALSSKPRSLRGKQGYVILDEAAFHDDLAGMMKAALALLIWGGKVLVISTHDGDDNAFNTLVNDARSGRRPYALLRCDFDEALRQGLYQRVCLATGETWSAEKEAEWRSGVIAEYGEDADEELFCIPARGKGAFLPAPLIEARMVDVPVLRWEAPADFAHWPEALRVAEAHDWCERHLKPLLKTLDARLLSFVGEDFGRLVDRTVIWPLQITRLMKRVTPFVVELGNMPFEQQRQVLFYICDRLPRFQGGALDATGNGAYLAEVAAQRYGAGRIAQVKLSIEWYRENMPRLKKAFEDAGIEIPRDADVMSDFRALKMIDGVAQLPRASRRKGEDGATRHGDAAIAAALGYHATVMPIAEYGYTPARRSDDDDRNDDQREAVRTTARFGDREGIW